MLKRFRSSITGRWVTKDAAKADPAGTTSETTTDWDAVERQVRHELFPWVQPDVLDIAVRNVLIGVREHVGH